MVKIDKVVTRFGDDGGTALGDGARVPKFHPRIAALGSLDEANAFIGLASQFVAEPRRAQLDRIQNDLFDIGGDLCAPERPEFKPEAARFDAAKVERLDAEVAAANAGLPALKSFVLPNGTLAASYLHVARAIVRRAEREVAEVAFQAPVTAAILRYLNRLSDLLFILARQENDSGAADRLWRPGG